MRTMPNSFARRLALGLAVSLAIGLAVVTMCNTVWSVTRGAPIMTRWGEQSPVHVVLAGLPYFILAICGIRARNAWIAAPSLTAGFWGYYLWDIAHYAGVGANIGIGILMIFSPIAVTAGALLAWYLSRRA